MSWAQEKGEGAPEAAKPSTHRHFDRPIDFWKTGLGFEKAKAIEDGAGPLAAGKILVRENVWAQPIRMPDGSWTIYVPPKPILDFLENPTEETAKAYLAWKNDQAVKMKKALLLLAKAKLASGADGAPEEKDAPGLGAPAGPAPSPAFILTYFHQKDCPHCTTEDGILAEWLPKHPEGKLEVFEPGERPEVWKSYQVRGTPTLVFEDAASRRKGVLVGLTRADELEEALRRLRRIETSTQDQRNPTEEGKR